MDLIFITTLVFIFASALLGSFMSARKRDRCLKDFEDFHVTLEEKDGDQVQGMLNTYLTGIELAYLQPQPIAGHIETSYIIYQGQYDTIQHIHRYHHELSEENQQKRSVSIRKTYHPSAVRRFARGFRNRLSTLNEAVIQAISTVIGQAQKQRPKSTVLKAHGKRITAMGEDVITIASHTFEPILEKYIGKKVVLEVLKGAEQLKYCGILKEYTNQFIEILDILDIDLITVTLKPDQVEQRGFVVSMSDSVVKIENNNIFPLKLKQVDAGSPITDLDIEIKANTAITYQLQEPVTAQINLHFEIQRHLDAIIPRKHALIRHGGEWETSSL